MNIRRYVISRKTHEKLNPYDRNTKIYIFWISKDLHKKYAVITILLLKKIEWYFKAGRYISIFEWKCILFTYNP